MRTLKLLTLAMIATLAATQQYGDYDQDYGQDYSQDSLYHDYAMKQQEKDVGKVYVYHSLLVIALPTILSLTRCISS